MENSSRSSRTNLALPLLAAGCSVISLAMLFFAGFGTRLGFWNFRTGFAILKVAAWSGLGSALLSLVAGILALRSRRYLATLIALGGFICAAIAFAIPANFKYKAQHYPRIHDISTDLDHPPQFVAIPEARQRAQERTQAVAAQQLQGYPDLKTLVLPMPEDQAFSEALQTAKDMGWRVVAAVPQEGRIEATATTFWFGFKDDIVIRLFPAGERTLLDVRSVSRVGISDVGTNAARIRSFLAKMSHQQPK